MNPSENHVFAGHSRPASPASSILDCTVTATQEGGLGVSGNEVFRQSLFHGYTYLAQKASSPASKTKSPGNRRGSSDQGEPEDPNEAPMFTPFRITSSSSAAPLGNGPETDGDTPPPPAISSAIKSVMVNKSPKWATAENSILLTLIDSNDTSSTSSTSNKHLVSADTKFEYAPYLSTLLHAHEYCQSQLRDVPFVNTRSGSKGTVDYVYVRSEWHLAGNFCASKQQRLNRQTQKQNDVTVAATIPKASPYRNLHAQPHVHLYLVSCDNVEQYRTKVRPALMMFDKVCSGGTAPNASEAPISPTSSAASTPTNSTHGNNDPKVLLSPAPRKEPYLIIYVPKGQKPGLVGSVFGNRQFQQSNPNVAAGGPGGPGPLPDCATTKEREVYKRLCMDFTSQKVSMLSALPHFVTTLLAATATSTSTPPLTRGRKAVVAEANGVGVVNLSNTIGSTAPLNNLGGTSAAGTAVTASASGSSSALDIFSQEWSAMLDKLGNLLALAFAERSKSYLNELKRLEQLKLYDSMQYKWADTEFWLVKESMAFGFQQFRLYKEALLCYEELSAWIPFTEKCLLISVPGDDEGGSLLSLKQERSALETGTTTIPADFQEELESLEKSRRDVLQVEREAMVARVAAESDPETEAEKRRQIIQKALDLVWQYANTGDSLGFRRVITSSNLNDAGKDGPAAMDMILLLSSASQIPAQAAIAVLDSISSLQLHQYTYLRILHILVLLQRPVDILSRTCEFVVNLYKVRCQAATKSAGLADLKQKEAEIWALSTVWDVKCACEVYFSFASAQNTPPGSHSLVSRGITFVEQEREASRHLSQLLEFARLRLVKLGDLELAPESCDTSPSKYNPIRRAAGNRAVDTLSTWIPWSELSQQNKKSRPTMPHRVSGSSRSVCTAPREFNVTDMGTAVSSVSGGGDASTAFLNSVTMTNAEAFEDKYLELSDAIIALFDHSGRRRFASRLLGDQAEIYMDRGEFAYAAGLLEEIVDTVAKDGWHGLLFYRLFRLACCQRAMLDAPNYLQTLVKAFHPRFQPVSPKRVAELFQAELEALVKDESIKPPTNNPSSDRIYSHGMCPFLEMEMNIETNGLLGRKSHPLGYLRKKVIRHMCPAGEAIDVKLTIHCHLPREITVDSLRLFLMRADDFEHVYRTTGILENGENFRVLTQESANEDADSKSLKLQPGKNIVCYRWVPMSVGQYVISALDVQWGYAHFSHDCVSMRKAIQGIDVLPSDPTQKVVLNPLFLIPGETQEIRLAFSSNSDLINDGEVEFSCSEGLKVLPPGTPPPDSLDCASDRESGWVDKCLVKIEGCGLNQTQYIKALVKSDPIKPGDPAQSLHARVRTNYHHALYEQVIQGDEPEGPPMSSALDASVTTLGRPALTVNTANAYDLADGEVLVSVSLLCNTPVPFFIKKWECKFPPPLELLPDGDANDILADHPVAEGQEIYMSFTCRKMTQVDPDQLRTPESDDTRPTLVVVLRDDQGKSFRQVLPLDLDEIYERIKQELVFSGQNTAYAELMGSSEEGMVGSPVKFTYTVDVSSLNVTLKRKSSRQSGSTDEEDETEKEEVISSPLLYSVVCDHRFWILGGKVGGIVPTDGTFKLSFIGIPTQAGVHKRFPEMKLYYAAPSDGTPAPTLTVHCRVPETFVSLSFKNHLALAAPASIEASSN